MPDPPAAITLAIEISNPPMTESGGQVALARTSPHHATEIIATRAVAASSRHDDVLLPTIDRLCRDASVKPADLACIAVSAGPGGYTAVRIAVTTAKTIAIATRARLILVPTPIVALLSIDEAIRAAHPIRVILAWKRDDAFCADFVPGALPTQSPATRIRPLSEIARDTSHHITTDARLIETLRAQGARAPMHRASLTAANVARASVLLPPADPITAAPIYPREPEAVTKWRQLRKSTPSN